MEREGIQREYDQMEQEYNLQCSELNAARERISLLLQQLERSEQMVSITQENCQKEKDTLKHKVSPLHVCTLNGNVFKHETEERVLISEI